LKTIIFADGDNFSYKRLGDVIQCIGKTTKLSIKLFANHIGLIDCWKKEIIKYDFESVNIFQSKFGKKNSSDIVLSVEALKSLYEEDWDRFVFISGDGDFAYLFKTIKNNKKIVSIFSGEHSSCASRLECTDYHILYKKSMVNVERNDSGYSFYTKYFNKSIAHKKLMVVKRINDLIDLAGNDGCVEISGSLLREMSAKEGIIMSKRNTKKHIEHLGFSLVAKDKRVYVCKGEHTDYLLSLV
jgi:hypothetical protein